MMLFALGVHLWFPGQTRLPLKTTKCKAHPLCALINKMHLSLVLVHIEQFILLSMTGGLFKEA